jgi:hypothetical protein
MGTDATQHTGQGQVFHDDFQGLFIFARFDHVDVALHIQATGTGQAAGRFIAFVDGKSARDGLGILLVGSLFCG